MQANQEFQRTLSAQCLPLFLLLAAAPGEVLSCGVPLLEEGAPAVPAVPLLALSGVVAALDEEFDALLSAELAGGVVGAVDTLVSLLREHAAIEPANATIISAATNGFPA